jgi:mersacidin/lichenicidin family type 2 lantibiotic
MSKQNIIRAWKDENYRRSLSHAQRAALPENPVGALNLDELTAAEMAEIDGGYVVQTQECTNLFTHCTYMK